MTKPKNPTKKPAPATDTPAKAQPPMYNPKDGKAAFDSLADQLKAVRPEQFVSTRLDIEAAVLAALAVYAYATSEPLYSRFKKLHSIGEFDISRLDNLKPGAFAVLHALAEAKIAGALETEVKIPASLVEKAIATERRMQNLCEYNLKDHPVHGKEVARLRPGSSYRDIAGDLLGYARLYGLEPDIVAKDPKNYRPTDKAEAEEIAGQMLALLAAGMTPKQRAAMEQVVRSWTLLNGNYDDVSKTGLFLERDDPKAREHFPSLFAAARAAASRSKRGKKVEEQNEDQGRQDEDQDGKDEQEPKK